MNTRIKIFLILFCGLFLSSHVLAKTLFIDSSSPPPGFESLENTQHLRVSVVFMGQYIGTYYVKLQHGQLQFDAPAYLMAHLSGIKTNKNTLNILSQSFPLNIECYTNNISALPVYCKNLKNQLSYIVYRSEQQTVYLYMKQSTFKKPHRDEDIEYISAPKTGLSYINKLGAAGSFNTSQPYISRIYASAPNYYNIYSSNVLAYENNSFIGNVSQNNGINNGEHFQIQNLYAQRISENKIYTTGYIVNQTSPFLQSQTILGASVRSTLETVKNAENVLATPLIIFVPQASQVSIFKNEQLIFSQYLEAGYQRIYTGSFPDGAYQLTIKIGTNNPIYRFFSKGSALPPDQATQFYLLGGSLTNGMISNANNYNYLPGTLGIPVLQAGIDKRLSESIALAGDILLSSDQKSVDAGPIFLLGNAFVKTAVLVSSRNNFGVYTFFNTQKNRLSVSVILTKILYQNKTPDYYFLNNLIDNNSVSLSYQVSDNSLLGVVGNYTKSLSQPSSYNAGVFYQRQVANFNGTTLFWNAGYNKAAYVGNTYSLGLSVNFTHNQFAGTEAISWQDQSNNARGNQQAQPVAVQGNTVYSQQNEQGVGTSLNEIHAISSTVTSLAGTYNYTARQGFVAAYINHNRIQHSGNNTAYGGNLETELAVNPQAARLNGVDRGNKSGIFVQVDTGKIEDTASKFAVLDSANRKLATLSANQKIFISLPAYTDQNYTLVNLSKSDYYIIEPTRHVTLYPGNIDDISWKAEKRIIVIGRVLQKNGNKAMANIWIYSGENGIFSDEEGNFQLELSQNITTLSAGDSCQIALPKLMLDKVYLSLGDVTCQ